MALCHVRFASPTTRVTVLHIYHTTLEAKGLDSVEAAIGVGVVLAVKDEAERVRARACRPRALARTRRASE